MEQIWILDSIKKETKMIDKNNAMKEGKIKLGPKGFETEYRYKIIEVRGKEYKLVETESDGRRTVIFESMGGDLGLYCLECHLSENKRGPFGCFGYGMCDPCYDKFVKDLCTESELDRRLKKFSRGPLGTIIKLKV